jgi:hypothetical protein
MSATVDDIVIKINELKDAERAELLRRLNEPEPKNEDPKTPLTNGKKSYVHPNTIWIKENKHKYAGNYVALKDGKLIAYGRTIKEADLVAKAKGVDDPLLHYILPKDYLPWGGW